LLSFALRLSNVDNHSLEKIWRIELKETAMTVTAASVLPPVAQSIPNTDISLGQTTSSLSITPGAPINVRLATCTFGGAVVIHEEEYSSTAYYYERTEGTPWKKEAKRNATTNKVHRNRDRISEPKWEFLERVMERASQGGLGDAQFLVVWAGTMGLSVSFISLEVQGPDSMDPEKKIRRMMVRFSKVQGVISASVEQDMEEDIDQCVEEDESESESEDEAESEESDTDDDE
jgi:hypothetical protein